MKHSRSLLFAGLLATALPFSASAQSVVTEPTPTPAPAVTPTAEAAQVQGAVVSHIRRLVRDVQTNNDYIRSVGDFGAQLYLIADNNFFLDWRKPEAPTLTPIDLAIRGQPLYTAIIFYGEARDLSGNGNVSIDATVTRPDGSVYERRDAMVGFQGLVPTDDRLLQLSRNYLTIIISPDDPAGIYTVSVNIRDNVSRTTLPLKQTFVVR